MSDDVVVLLKKERDLFAAMRQEAFACNDIKAANGYDAMSSLLFRAIQEIERSRVIIGVMKDVMMRRIVESAVGEAYKERLE